MSIEAHVIAIGPHDQDLAKHYEYAKSAYEHVPRGTEIVTQISQSFETANQCRELAELFGASLDDPASWVLDPSVDLSGHDSVLLESISAADFEELQAAHAALSEAGFRFFLRVDR